MQSRLSVTGLSEREPESMAVDALKENRECLLWLATKLLNQCRVFFSLEIIRVGVVDVCCGSQRSC